MACLRWRDITQRLARHLVDRSRWLGAAAPHRSSGRARRESGRVARRTAPRVSAGTHGGSRCDLSRAADVRSRSDRHPAPAYRRQPGVIGLAWTPDGRDLVFSSGGHLGLSRMAKISEVSQSSRTREPEFLPFGERATAISIAETGRLVYSAQSRDTALYELALRDPASTVDSGRARRLLLDVRRTDPPLFAGRTTAGIRVDPVRSGGDLDCQQGRFESAAGDVHGRTTVLESPVVAATGGPFSSARAERARRTSICFSPTPAHSLS